MKDAPVKPIPVGLILAMVNDTRLTATDRCVGVHLAILSGLGVDTSMKAIAGPLGGRDTMIRSAQRAVANVVAAGWFTRTRKTAKDGTDLPSRYEMADSIPAGMEEPPWEDASKIKETIIRLAGEA